MESEKLATHQEKLGPAPIASFEDLSEETENGEQSVQNQSQKTTPVTPGSSLKTPSTPRIDISRASSSSHHEDSSNSRESSPERELLAGAEPPTGCKLTLNYKEDAQELRSSTEELDLQDPIHEQDFKREAKRSAKREKEYGTQSECGVSIKFQERERKDSNCSEIILLNISGRTSRLSSVGSQGSGHSGKLSVTSNMSSRSPSPHKCLLETSFCGRKPSQPIDSIEHTKAESDDIEKILLKREADTTKALIPENINVPIMGGNLKPDPLDKPRRRGREERKEIFKREVEITKRVLEQAHIEVPIIRKPKHIDDHEREIKHEILKPEMLDLTDSKKKSQNPTNSGTTTPSSSSRKNSFVSLFKVRTDGDIDAPKTSNTCTKSRRVSSVKTKDTSEKSKNVSSSRERVCNDSEILMNKETRSRSIFSSTLSLFKRRERKKSFEEISANTFDNEKTVFCSEDTISPSDFSFNAENQPKKRYPISIDFPAKNVYDEEALPSESVSIPLETPTKLFDEYGSDHHLESIITKASIEHHRESPVTQEPDEISENKKTPSCHNNTTIPLTCSHNIEIDSNMKPIQVDNNAVKHLTHQKRDIAKPKRKSKEEQQMQMSNPKEESIECLHGNNVSDLDRNSSESEKDSEIEFIKNKTEKAAEELSDERRGLFYEESFEEDMSFIPTTLTFERSNAVSIVPARKRHQEVRTISVERPRSTTPINPTLLDEFVMTTSMDDRCTEKMKIYLPKADSYKLKSPRKITTNTFTKFAGKVPDSGKRSISKTPSPPPIPPRLFSTQPSNWINFEEIPEKRKAPKRIQTIPRSEDESKNSTYNYVQPDECRCECHEEQRRASMRDNGDITRSSSSCTGTGTTSCNGKNCIIPRSSSDRASNISDSSLECSLSLEDSGTHAPSNQCKPFGMDLDLKSNRSSVASQEDTDDAQSKHQSC